MDNMTVRQRRRTMASIRSQETCPEKTLRSALHRRGFRFRKNVRELAGKPDIVLAKHKTAIFVNGCFWHQHLNCARAVLPKSNCDYWGKKLMANVRRDGEAIRTLLGAGLNVITVWECEINKDVDAALCRITSMLSGKRPLVHYSD